MGLRTYAIPDLHGRYDLMQKALAKIYVQEQDGQHEHTVVFLGDYVDRGRQSRQIVERLMLGPRRGAKWVVLKGNHEDMLVGAYDGTYNVDLWVGYGGGATLISYGHPTTIKTNDELDMTVVPNAHIRWAEKLPILHSDWHRVYVHAGLDSKRSLEDQLESQALWKIYSEEMTGDVYPGYHVVHGHDGQEDGPLLYPHRSNLDTYAYRTNRLCVAVFDDEKVGGPIGLMEIR